MKSPPDDLIDTTAAAERYGVPAALIAKWKHRRLLVPAGLVRGPGRGGRAPLYRPADIEPLATRYHQRTTGGRP